MFALLRVGPNLAQNVHSQKSIFYFLKLIHSILHPLNFRVYSRNILLVAILAVNIVRLDKICYAKWAHGIGGMGQNLRKTPKTIRGFIIYLTISLKNSFLSDIEDRIHQTLIAYIFLTSDAYITFSASIVPVLISALHRATKRQNRPRIEKKSF